MIYRQERLESGEVPGHIVLYNASDIYEEADFVARRIQKLVQEEGYRYREITVIARETESYRGVWMPPWKAMRFPILWISRSLWRKNP